MSGVPLPDIALVDNTSQRLPCVLVLDASGSMGNPDASTDPIRELNAGLKILESELKKDDVASQRVQLLVIKFSGDDSVDVVTDWTDAIDFSAPTLEAYGRTPMGPAVRLALQKIEEQKQNYKSHGIPYNRPWLFLITDGEPTDLSWEVAAAECRGAEEANKTTVFAIGTEEANFDKLAKFSKRTPMKLKGIAFKELFLWLSQSSSSASKAAQGSATQLPSPAGWGEAPG